MVTNLLRRAYLSFATHILDVPPRLTSFLALLLLTALPITMGRGGLTIVVMLTNANIMAIFATSWDLLVGRTGQISMGHGLFYGIGAYSTALLFVYYGLPLWITVPLSLFVSALAALVIGYPCLRVKGAYLALVTMALPIILIGLLSYFKDITGGERGVYGLPRFFPFLSFYEQRIANYYLTLLLLLASAIIMYKVANSRTGIVFVSILDDELASKASGINTTKYKLLAFAISGLFAALAGSINAHLLSVANKASLEVTLSFMPIIITILGGIGTVYGPIAGAYILTVLDRYVLTTLVDIPSQLHIIIYIIFIIVLIIVWPRGIARFTTEKLEDLQEERELEERGKHIWKTYKSGA